jgi:NitT/TauT family transport system substrate-binding protein
MTWNKSPVAFAAVCCGLLFLATGATGFAADKVRVGKAQSLAWIFLPVDVGIAEGIFARSGLEVEIIDLAGDAKVQQALAADSIDFGLGSGPGMAFLAKGSPAMAVAAFGGAPRGVSTMVLANSSIEKIADLKGKLVAVSTAGSLTEWLTKQMALQEGWGADGIRTVALGAISNSLASLKAGQVDAVTLATESGFALEEAKQGRIVAYMDKYAPHFISEVVFVQNRILQNNPALIGRFLKGFFAAIAFEKSNEDKTSAIAVRVLHQSPAVARRTYDYEISMFETDGSFDPKAVEVLKQSFVDTGTLDKKPGDDALFTTKFLPVKP